MLKLHLRAARREAEELEEASAGPQVPIEQAVAQLQARLLPLVDERRQRYAAELDAARGEAESRIEAERHSLSCAAEPVVEAVELGAVTALPTVGEGDLVEWAEDLPQLGAEPEDLAQLGSEPEAVSPILTGSAVTAGALLSVDVGGPAALPGENEMGESVPADTPPESAAIAPVVALPAPFAPPPLESASEVASDAQQRPEATSSTVPSEVRLEGDTTVAEGAAMSGWARPVAPIVPDAPMTESDDEFEDRVQAEVARRLGSAQPAAPASAPQLAVDSAAIATAIAAAVAAVAAERPSVGPPQAEGARWESVGATSHHYPPAPPKRSFWADSWHADVLLSLIALVIVVVVLVAWTL